MATKRQIEQTRTKEQSGIVLLTVLLLVVMFTGIGLMAMRHTQGELRSAGAYMDSTQAALAAEAGLTMVATDMRLNFEDESAACVSYAAQFNTASWGDYTAFRAGGEKTFFSPAFNPDCTTYVAGTVPLPELSGTAALAETPVLSNATADVVIVQERPVLAGPPPGFSSDGQNQSYDWYVFTVHSTASYGVPASGGTNPLYVRGNAEAEARIMIGPVLAF
jgi:Tfp pilus assembly protein PilX